MRTYRNTAYRKKAKKEGVNRKTVHLFVAIAYNNSFVMCEQFLGNYNGESYSKVFRKYFPATFVKTTNSEVKLFY